MGPRRRLEVPMSARIVLKRPRPLRVRYDFRAAGIEREHHASRLARVQLRPMWVVVHRHRFEGDQLDTVCGVCRPLPGTSQGGPDKWHDLRAVKRAGLKVSASRNTRADRHTRMLGGCIVHSPKCRLGFVEYRSSKERDPSSGRGIGRDPVPSILSQSVDAPLSSSPDRISCCTGCDVKEGHLAPGVFPCSRPRGGQDGLQSVHLGRPAVTAVGLPTAHPKTIHSTDIQLSSWIQSQ